MAENGDRVMGAAWKLIGVAVVASLMRILSRLLIFNSGRKVEYDIRNDSFAHLMRMSPAFYQRMPLGQVMSRLVNDLTQVRLLLGPGILNLTNTGLVYIVVIPILFASDFELTLYALMPMPALLMLGRMFAKRMYVLSRDQQEKLGVLSEKVQENLSGVMTVRAYQREADENKTFLGLNEVYLTVNIALARLRGLMFPLMGMAGGIGGVVLLWIGGHRIASGRMSVGDFVQFNAYLAALTWPTIALGWMISLWQRGLASMDRINDIFLSEPDLTDGPVQPQKFTGRIEVTDLTFSYAEGAPPALSNVSTEIEAGETVVIVGKTGSGKSTLLKALARLLVVPRGSIALDGVDVVDLPLGFVRGLLGYAPQDAFLFSRTILRERRVRPPRGRRRRGRDLGSDREPRHGSLRLPRGPRDGRGRARHHPIGRTAPAHHAGPRDPGERSDPAPRRHVERRRHGDREQDPRRAHREGGRAHHHRGDAPPGLRRPRRSDPRPRGRPRDRAGERTRASPEARGLRPHARAATAPRSAGAGEPASVAGGGRRVTEAANVKLRRKKVRGVTEDVTFGKAYDAQLVRRLAVFFKPHFGLFVLTLISYPTVAGLNLVQPYLVKVAIDEHLVPKQLDGFGIVVGLLVGALILQFAAQFGQTMLSQILGQRVTRDLRAALFQKLQEVDLAYIEKNPVGRLMTRVTNDVESLSETFSTGAISILGDIVTLVGIVVMMLALDIQLTLYAFLCLPILLGMITLMRRYAREAFRKVRSLLARINSFLNEAISGMSLIQVFGQEENMQAEFEEVNAEYRDANFDAIRYDAITYAVVEGIATISTALVLLLGWKLFQRGTVEIGLFVAFIDYLRRFFQPITELSTKYTVLQSAMASAERCVDLLDQQPTVLEPTEPRAIGPFSDAIRFEDVRFRYGPSGPDILHGLNLSIRRGERVAIVGPTGSGKSTIVKMIARFYDPRCGRVTIDGLDLRELALPELRKKLAVVLQDSYLFDGSIEANIAFGRSETPRSLLEDAAERTRAIEVIRRQEEGWNARVGERGSRLSAGERQLVAFARALALDPEILVLDEATSSVDPETEALIQRGLEALITDRTALIVAHRLSTVRSADRIVVLAGGRVVEEGSHEALLMRGGVYRKLYELQFAEGSTEMPAGVQLAGITT